MKTLDPARLEMPAPRGSASPLLSLASALMRLPGTLIGALSTAYARGRDRAVLAELDDRILKDVGLTRAQAGARPTPSPMSLW